MMYVIVSPSGQSVTFVHNTGAVGGIAAQGETPGHDSQAVNGQQVNTNSQELAGQRDLQLDDHPRDVESTNVVDTEESTNIADNARTEGSTDVDLARPIDTDGKPRRNRPARFREALVKAIVGGALSLILLPGIFLGVLMKQTMAGLALSSAITSLINLYAGLYYYLHK